MPTKWLIIRVFKLVVLIAAIFAIGGCGTDGREHERPLARDSSPLDTNVIPAPVLEILENADSFELLSLEPSYGLKATEGDFHGYPILGTAVINDPEIREKLVIAFKKAVAEKPDSIAACFNPRHGIRVGKNRREADFVICFECRQVQVSSGDVSSELLINSSARELFNTILRSKGIRLADM